MKSNEFINENIEKTDRGWIHSGTGHRRDTDTDEYPTYKLPRWSSFEQYNRPYQGTYKDIIMYMKFAQDNYQTNNMDISGNEIASVLVGDDAIRELDKFNNWASSNFSSWDEMYTNYRRIRQDEFIASMTR